jgi:hypothetical protein
MRLPFTGGIQRLLRTLAVLVAFSAALAHASATLLLEEPYGKLGFFAATGHAAVYLSDVCAETPLVLRPCAPGELGAVVSRYDGVGGYDWIAVPLLPYLYAVDRPDEIPLFVDAKMVEFLRDQYRRNHLEIVAPDSRDGAAPGGNWYELVGTAYDRTTYAFEIETSPAQDKALIRKLNSAPNQSHFRTVSRNCADFVKDVINFYYPRALHRSLIADLGMTTPKQMAKTFVKFSARHPRFESSRFVIPQVPGSPPRSTAVHGVVESFLKSKKYFVPSAVASPIFGGCVLAVYEGTGAGRFAPAKDALVFSPQRDPEPPLGAEDRRSYEIELNHLLARATPEVKGARLEKAWERVQANALPEFDAEGRPALQIRTGDQTTSVGIAAGNVFVKGTQSPFAQQLLEARLREELRRGTPKASESDVARDWKRLQQALDDDNDAPDKDNDNDGEPTVAQSRQRPVEPVTWPLDRIASYRP